VAPPDDADLDLDAAIARLFAGPPDEFVPGRDALVRTLRAAKRADDVAAVKALRKPKAVARALDAAALADPDAVAALAAAVADVGRTQEDGGDVRAALAALRDAERAVTEAAVAAVAGDDRPPDASTLGAAVRAVLADPEALAALQAVRLADVPAGGGFGLAGLSGDLAPPRARPAPAGDRDTGRREPAAARRQSRTTAREPVAPAATTARRAGEPKAVATARRAVEQAEQALREAGEALAEVTADVETAEDDERAARAAADEAARRADEARDHALAVARVATTARREAAARTRRRDEAAAALAKAEARLAKLDRD
jgi:hypothetical protein